MTPKRVNFYDKRKIRLDKGGVVCYNKAINESEVLL